MKRGKSAAVAALICLVLAVLVAGHQGGFAAPDARAGFAAWSDGFFAAGALVGGFGLLAFASADGLFDIIRYGVGKMLRLGLKKEKRDAYPKTFFDYRQQKRGGGFSGLTLALVGLGSIALGGVFLWFYWMG